MATATSSTNSTTTSSTSTYTFSFPSPAGTLPITQLGFTLKFSSEDSELKFTEGLATYNTFDLTWSPDTSHTGYYVIVLDNYHCFDAKTGEIIPIDIHRPTKKFKVDSQGQFIELTNIDDLVKTVEQLTLQTASQVEIENDNNDNNSDSTNNANDITNEQTRQTFVKQYIESSRAQTKQAVSNEVSLMWNALVQSWLDVPTTTTTDNVFFQGQLQHAGQACVKLGKSFKQDPNAYKQLVQQQITNTFSLTLPESELPHIEVVAAQLTTEFVATLEKDSLRAHIADFTRVNESLFFVQDEQQSSLEIKAQRWLLAWPNNPELASETFLSDAYDAYVQVAQATFSQVLQNLGLDDDADDDADDALEPFAEEQEEQVADVSK